MAILIKKLDSIFLPDKGRRQFSVFNDMYSLRRDESENINIFVSQFENKYFKFKQEATTLPGPDMAFMVLSSCNLTETNVQLVMSAIHEITYDNMKAIIMRIFGSDMKAPHITNTPFVEIKSEPTFTSTHDSFENSYDDSTCYTNSNYYTRGRGYNRGGGNRRPRNGRSAYRAPNVEHHYADRVQRGGRKGNPIDSDRKISRCLICDSRLHWARDCPHASENLATSKTKVHDNSEHV